jgi:hypothetical protein
VAVAPLAAAAVIVLVAGGCVKSGNEGGSHPPPAAQVLDRYSPAWMAVPGVVGTGVGTCEDRPCLKVFVIERTPEIERRIPHSADGYPVVVEVTGVVRPRG